jgi:hypothetical protein
VSILSHPAKFAGLFKLLLGAMHFRFNMQAAIAAVIFVLLGHGSAFGVSPTVSAVSPKVAPHQALALVNQWYCKTTLATA